MVQPRSGRGGKSARGKGRGAGRGRSSGDEDGPVVVTLGVNKLKSGIRQMRRLLSKDLEPGKRIEAERRLNALERDLEAQLHAGKERNFALRYHKVKFFERQKVHRRIRQLKKALQFMPENKQKTARAQLHEARVMLNYVMVRIC